MGGRARLKRERAAHFGAYGCQLVADKGKCADFGRREGARSDADLGRDGGQARQRSRGRHGNKDFTSGQVGALLGGCTRRFAARARSPGCAAPVAAEPGTACRPLPDFQAFASRSQCRGGATGSRSRPGREASASASMTRSTCRDVDTKKRSRVNLRRLGTSHLPPRARRYPGQVEQCRVQRAWL